MTWLPGPAGADGLARITAIRNPRVDDQIIVRAVLTARALSKRGAALYIASAFLEKLLELGLSADLNRRRKKIMSATVVIVGPLVRDPKTTPYAEGRSVTNFTVATEGGFGDNRSTTFWRCTTMGASGERAGRILTKGDWVEVSGSARLGTFTTQAGVERPCLDVTVDRWPGVGRQPDFNTRQEVRGTRHGKDFG